MDSVVEVVQENKKSILKSADVAPSKKSVYISEELLVIDDNIKNTNHTDGIEDIQFSENKIIKDDICVIDRSTSPAYKFSMEEFLSNLDSSIDISKINEYDVAEEVLSDGKLKNANCNTFYSSDIFLLNNAVNSQDKKKSKEERKKEREKKKEEDLFKKYQIEQEAKHKAIARSKCGRWVKFNIKIGEGGYKFVYRGYDVIEARNVAWCEFKREHVDTKEKRGVMFKETEIMLKMNHSHIVRCFEVLKEWHILEDQQTSLDEKGIVIIQELMGEGTLKNIIKKNFIEGQCILKFPLITRWWHQILDALRYMHVTLKPPIIHRDLKADNCFLYGQTDDECLNVKVGDFGLATHVNISGRKTMLGTLGFMAPEIFDEKYDESVDIYAFGMLMLEVMTNRTPYDECETIVQVAAKTLTGKGPKVLEKVSDKWLREIINSCIHPLACYRPTAEELFYHPIFQCKSLRVEVELNYDKMSDRTEVIDRFISNILSNTKVNLRLRFRDKRMLQELGLDDGESLEFDLDIYKAEDQDIPELIQSLRLEYEDKLSRVYDNPKIQDKRTISSNLDKLFLSLELQMKCLVKHLLGRRWRDILDSLVAQKATKTGDGELESSDDQDEDNKNSFTMISKYKGLWTKAKRLLDKEIQCYRENSSKESKELNSPTKHMDTKQHVTKYEDQICPEIENIDNDNTLNIRNLNSMPIEDPMSITVPQCENELIDNSGLLQGKNQFQVVTSNSNITMDVHDITRDQIIIDTSNSIIKSAEIIEPALKDILTHKHISYNIRIQSLENYSQAITVTFVVEIPDFTKADCGKWVLSFRCVITEYSNLDCFELNASGIYIDKVDHEVNVVLQETVQSALKLIQLNRNCIIIDQNYVFYPKEENVILCDLYPKVLANLRNEASNCGSNSEYFNQSFIETNEYIAESENIRSNIMENSHEFENISRSNVDNSLSIEIINEKIKNYLDSLFENESTVLLIKKTESDEKQIIKAHSIPLGTAVVINNDMTVQNIKKTTIISPKVELTGNVFVRELDKSDLSMDKAINILSLLQEKIEDVSSKEFNKDLGSEIILFETKLKSVDLPKGQPNVESSSENLIDKQKIIEQVWKQKKEIEKLQLQQSQFLALLENHAKLIPQTDQDIVNQQKINNKLYFNQMNSTFNSDNCYMPYHQAVINPNQVVINSNDPRLLMSNNSIKNNSFVTADGQEYPNTNNMMMDNSFRPPIRYLKGPITDNPSLNMIGKDFHHVDGNIRFTAAKDPGNVSDMNRMFSDPNTVNYPIDRMDHNETNLHQLYYHGIEQMPEEMLTKGNYNPMIPNTDLKNPDPAMMPQYYSQNYPFIHYKFPYSTVYLQQPLSNFYDQSKLVVAAGYKAPIQHLADDTIGLRKEIMPEDINLKNESLVDSQIRAEPIAFSTFPKNEPTANYREGFVNQKFLEKTSDTCINVQKHSIEDVTKDAFNNR